MSRTRCCLVVVLCLLCAPARAEERRPLEFHLTFDRTVRPEPFTGRVYVLLSQKTLTALPAGPSWFKPEPFFAVDVKDWKPGETRTVGADALACPEPLAKLARGSWTVYAVMDLDR